MIHNFNEILKNKKKFKNDKTLTDILRVGCTTKSIDKLSEYTITLEEYETECAPINTQNIYLSTSISYIAYSFDQKSVFIRKRNFPFIKTVIKNNENIFDLQMKEILNSDSIAYLTIIFSNKRICFYKITMENNILIFKEIYSFENETYQVIGTLDNKFYILFKNNNEYNISSLTLTEKDTFLIENILEKNQNKKVNIFLHENTLCVSLENKIHRIEKNSLLDFYGIEGQELFKMEKYVVSVTETLEDILLSLLEIKNNICSYHFEMKIQKSGKFKIFKVDNYLAVWVNSIIYWICVQECKLKIVKCTNFKFVPYSLQIIQENFNFIISLLTNSKQKTEKNENIISHLHFDFINQKENLIVDSHKTSHSNPSLNFRGQKENLIVDSHKTSQSNPSLNTSLNSRGQKENLIVDSHKTSQSNPSLNTSLNSPSNLNFKNNILIPMTSESNDGVKSDLIMEMTKLMDKIYLKMDEDKKEKEMKDKKRIGDWLDKMSNHFNTTLNSVIENAIRREMKGLSNSLKKTISDSFTNYEKNISSSKNRNKEDNSDIIKGIKEVIIERVLPAMEASVEEMRLQVVGEFKSLNPEDFLRERLGKLRFTESPESQLLRLLNEKKTEAASVMALEGDDSLFDYFIENIDLGMLCSLTSGCLISLLERLIGMNKNNIKPKQADFIKCSFVCLEIPDLTENELKNLEFIVACIEDFISQMVVEDKDLRLILITKKNSLYKRSSRRHRYD
ncbi:hypothetical protein CWI36_0723p0020 [Hamiltosporidium magnivora]|uniref:Uncharacterized protein n=1 Tax=Hamiltosporidium magnivora TaxID=148818 RepID=A0A4Q9LAK0_9MICR|nr:hypothetical protein CWI36_0723p0020 [Hamiltosporidium magnivora]